MRELAKSMISFSWAMGIFGLEQLGNVLRDVEEGEEETREGRVTNAFDSVTEATQSRFRKRGRDLFEAGDRLQREMVDLLFDVVSSDELKPEKVIDRAVDFAERSADKLREVVEDRRTRDEGEAHA